MVEKDGIDTNIANLGKKITTKTVEYSTFQCQNFRYDSESERNWGIQESTNSLYEGKQTNKRWRGRNVAGQILCVWPDRRDGPSCLGWEVIRAFMSSATSSPSTTVSPPTLRRLDQGPRPAALPHIPTASNSGIQPQRWRAGPVGCPPSSVPPRKPLLGATRTSPPSIRWGALSWGRGVG